MAARLFSSRSTMSHLHGPCGTPREYGAASEETSRSRWSMVGDAGFEPQWRSALFRCCHDRCEQFLRVEDRNGRLREVDAIPGDDCRRPGVSRSFMQHRILEVREVEVERPVEHVPVHGGDREESCLLYTSDAADE